MKTNFFTRFLFQNLSYPKMLKLTVFIIGLAYIITVTIFHISGYFSQTESRVILHSLYVVVFMTSFFSGSTCGFILATFSSGLAVYALVPGDRILSYLTFSDYEVFTIISFSFLIVIAVDWFKINQENLLKQIEKNQQLYEQARQIEKLALAGEIAAGITHEIRNPLTVIHGYMQLLAKHEEQGKNSEIYKLIIDEIKRTNEIISDFLHFSRPAQPNKMFVQLNSIVEATISLLRGESVKHNVTIHSYTDPELPEVFLDKEQIMQALLNLCANGIQAMEEGGSLTVSTSWQKDSGQVSISISDTGHGIDQETISKILTPFYTTRENGTGLGLAITQSITRAHQGKLEIESTPGQGSRFTIILPQCQETTPAEGEQ